MKKKIILVVVLVISSIAIITFYLYREALIVRTPFSPRSQVGTNTSTQNVQGLKHSACLGDNEVANYRIENNPEGGALVFISITDKTTNVEINNLQVPILGTGYAHPIELHKCGIYVLRKFNYDYKKNIYLPGYSLELWRYDYSGEGNKLIILGNKDLDGKENAFFQLNFNVNNAEDLITLTRGYLGSSDYAIVVKDLKTFNDILVLTQEDLVKNYGVPQYEIGAGRWIDDKTFLVFVTAGAVSYDEIVVHQDENNNWKLTVLPIPEDASIVTAWNPDGYWIAYNNGPGWIGAEEVAQDIYKQWRAEGKTQSLFVYNLATKQKITLASKIDPAWSFKTTWISTTTLEYYTPPGEKKIYKIAQ